MTQPPLARRLLAEGIGTALLLAVVVGSGVMAQRLAETDRAMALLANSIATGAGLVALVLALGGVSAHFNPAVTLAAAAAREIAWREVLPYVAVQIAGAGAGVVVAHAMFGLPAISSAADPRSGAGQAIGELVATFGLLVVIAGSARRSILEVALAVGAYIAAAYWFTSSTSFANPAVTLARALTGTFAGIRLADVPAFIAAQLAGAGLAILASRRLFPREVA
jgi:glycerol uptake facilitator-like aquaporin